MKSLKELADLTGSEVKGDTQLQVSDVATLKDAKQDQISFVSNPKYRKQLDTTKASAVILSPKMASAYSGHALINNDPYLTFAKVVNAFHKQGISKANIHPSAVIATDSIIGKNVNIAANVVIDSAVNIGNNAVIGAGSVIGKDSVLGSGAFIHPNVTIYSDTQIGTNAIVHSGAVIGSDGFGFAPQKDKSWYKILQIGNVVIGDDVEIGANTTVDRAALGSTTIGNGVKLDNQVQIAHNVKIGDFTIIAGAVGIAGSTIVGERCQIGGAVAISGHLNIADDVIITGRGMVISSIKEPGVYSSGIVIDENRKWRRNAARFRHLDDMAKQIKELKNAIAIIKNNREK
ncbi:MAG TPA: UDP-3-O-(3-hydroxymyristoyl)glucosamine N-acyltransferase [Leucothrix sp.]|nr:UDP-3-O-(3-hydroxymyristoyl)glucosamine N-acyltransferase [Leucothrix sp.]